MASSNEMIEKFKAEFERRKVGPEQLSVAACYWSGGLVYLTLMSEGESVGPEMTQDDDYLHEVVGPELAQKINSTIRGQKGRPTVRFLGEEGYEFEVVPYPEGTVFVIERQTEAFTPYYHIDISAGYFTSKEEAQRWAGRPEYQKDKDLEQPTIIPLKKHHPAV